MENKFTILYDSFPNVFLLRDYSCNRYQIDIWIKNMILNINKNFISKIFSNPLFMLFSFIMTTMISQSLCYSILRKRNTSMSLHQVHFKISHDFWSILGYIYIYLPGKIYLLARNIYSFMYSFFLKNQRDLVLIISPQILWIFLWIYMKTLLFICTNIQIMMSTPPLPFLLISKMYIFNNNRMMNRLWIPIHYHPFY